MPVFEKWRVVGLYYGRVWVSGHAVRHAPETGSNKCPLRGEEGTLPAGVWRMAYGGSVLRVSVYEREWCKVIILPRPLHLNWGFSGEEPRREQE